MPTSTSRCSSEYAFAKLSARHVPEKGLSGLTGRYIFCHLPLRKTFNLPPLVSKGSASAKKPLPAIFDCPIIKKECTIFFTPPSSFCSYYLPHFSSLRSRDMHLRCAIYLHCKRDIIPRCRIAIYSPMANVVESLVCLLCQTN